MKIKKHPLLVVFEEAECCVLRHALAGGAYAGLLDEVIEAIVALENIPAHDLALLGERFTTTSCLIFIPGITSRVFYNGVACAEKKAVVEGSRTFLCSHKKEAHMKALDKIIWLMACPQGQN